MDKKNTMLLTVIAVATLLVAVVGATFAYFSVTGANDEVKTTITTTTEDVGTVALTNPTTKPLHLTLAAVDMSLTNAGTPYYATIGSGAYSTSEEAVDVALATVTGGEEDTKYSCEFTLGVTVAGDMADLLEEGDAQIVFEGANFTAENSTYDLANGSTTFDVVMNELTGTATTQEVSAYVVFNNRKDVDGQTGSGKQNYLANKTLTVEVQNTEFSCDIID